MSLTLDAVSPSDSGTTSEANDVTKQIQTLHKYLVQHKSKDSRISRCVWREIYDKFTEEGLDYNIVTRCTDSLLKQITALEDKIKELNVVLETLKNGKSESEKEIEGLKTKNVRNMKEIEMLKKENETMVEENRKLKNEHNSEIEILKMQNKTMVEEVNELTKENERLKEENKSVALKTDPRGAIGPGPSRSPRAPDEQCGVKLHIIYVPSLFSPASCPEVTSQGKWPFNPLAMLTTAYIKCEVRGIRPGSTPFKEVIAVLQPLFSKGKISMIRQWLASAAGRTVTMVTSRDYDEGVAHDKTPYCGVDGKEHSWQEARKPGPQDICEGGSVFVCGGERRTVMWIRR